MKTERDRLREKIKNQNVMLDALRACLGVHQRQRIETQKEIDTDLRMILEVRQNLLALEREAMNQPLEMAA